MLTQPFGALCLGVPLNERWNRWNVSGETHVGITIVVPCFNEESRWNARYWSQLTADESTTWIFVNDGSSDSTSACIAPLISRENVSYLELAANSGKAEAVRQGMLGVLADKQSSCSGIGYLDADGAFAPDVVNQIAASFRQHSGPNATSDAVWSSRVALSGREIHRRTSRHYLGRLIATFAAFGTDSFPYDTQSGLKIFVPSVPLHESLLAPFETRWLFEIELLSRWKALTGQAMRVWEEPVLSWIEVSGSKIDARESLRIARELLIIKRVQRAEAHALVTTKQRRG